MSVEKFVVLFCTLDDTVQMNIIKYNEDTFATLLYFYFAKVLNGIKLKIRMNIATLTH